MAAPPPRPTGSTSRQALLPLLSAEETDRGVRDTRRGRSGRRVLAADGFAIAKDTDARSRARLAASDRPPCSPRCQSRKISRKPRDVRGPRVRVRGPGRRAGARALGSRDGRARARVVGDEYAKARKGWPGKDGASKVVDAGTIARMAAAIDAMRAADANAAEAAAGMTRGAGGGGRGGEGGEHPAAVRASGGASFVPAATVFTSNKKTSDRRLVFCFRRVSLSALAFPALAPLALLSALALLPHSPARQPIAAEGDLRVEVRGILLRLSCSASRFRP